MEDLVFYIKEKKVINYFTQKDLLIESEIKAANDLKFYLERSGTNQALISFIKKSLKNNMAESLRFKQEAQEKEKLEDYENSLPYKD